MMDWAARIYDRLGGSGVPEQEHRGFGLVGDSDCLPFTEWLVLIAEDCSAGDQALLRFPPHGVESALAALLSFLLSKSCAHEGHHFAFEGIEVQLPPRRIVPDGHAVIRQRVERIHRQAGV